MLKLARLCYTNLNFGAAFRNVPAAYFHKGFHVETLDSYKYNIKPIQPIESAYSRFKPSNERSSIPIIILHCIFGSRKQWESLGMDIAERTGRTVYALDARNHGASDRAILSDFWALSLDVEYFMAIHGIPRCQVLGHSLGGRTGMFMAINKPELVDKLLVQDISPVSIPKNIADAMAFTSKALKELMNDLPEGVSLAQAQIFAHERLAQAAPFPTFRQLLVDTLEERDGQIICNVNLDYFGNPMNVNAEMIPFPTTDGQFRGPVQFLCADKPQYVRYEDYEGIRNIFPNAKLVRVKSANHMMHLEIPEHYANLVADFFEDVHV